MKTPVKPKYTALNSELQSARQAEADKTNRLRALRLAKEATEREAAAGNSHFDVIQANGRLPRRTRR